MRGKPFARAFVFVAATLLTMCIAQAQDEDVYQEQEVRGICFVKGQKTAAVSGFIGGESHDSYIIHLREGRRVTVRILSTRNRAGFSVSASEFGEPVSFGKESEGGRVWTGTVPQTGPYYISVVAHPQARYTLKVTVKD